MRIELDCSIITDREILHDILMEQFHFPEYYGRNLDALYDLLTDISEDTEVIILNSDSLRENLGVYSAALIVTLNQASENNPYFSFQIY